MPIYLGSRYENSTVDFVAFTASTDALPVVFYQFPDIGYLEYREYSWQTGDRWDNLAMKFYSDPAMWWVIANANPKITDITQVPAGTVVKIPNV